MDGARGLLIAITLGSTLGVGIPVRAHAQVGTCAPARTALVLAGGGAKGFAHIGLLRTLDSLGIVPDLIVGTSIGAIVGAMYASGLTGAEIDTLLRRLPLSSVVRTYEPHVSNTLGGLRPVVVWERTPSQWVVQAGAFQESEVNALISRLLLRANLIARGDFDRLPIPFRAVAGDLNTRRPVVLEGGDLAEAVRASFALPVVLRPVNRDGKWLSDGGIASNVPVGTARARGAERLIVSILPSAPLEPQSFEDPLSVSGVLFEYLWVQDSLGLGPEDVLVSQPTEGFSPMGFDSLTLDSLVRMGRRTSDSVFAGGVCARPLRRTRGPERIPERIGRVGVLPRELLDRDLILRDAGVTGGSALDTNAIVRGIERFATTERYRAVWLNPSGGGDSINFDLAAIEAPQRSFGIGFAFDNLMSGRFWAGGVDRKLVGRDLEGAALVATGTYRTEAMVAARRRARIGNRYWPIGVSVEGFAEDVRLYSGAGELAPAKAAEVSVLAGIRPLFEAGWTYELGPEYRLWREPGLGTRGTAGGRVAVRLRRQGSPDPIVALEAIVLAAWQSSRLEIAATQAFGRFEVRPRLRVGWGHRLPIQHTFTLGGLDGFAGLRMLEVRGEHEAFASMLFRWPLGRLLNARIEPMAGIVGSAPGIFVRRGADQGLVLAGLRVGIDLESPIGPIRVEQGFNNQDRRAALVRFGYWF